MHRVIAFAFCVIPFANASRADEAGSPLDDAVAVWHMATTNDTAGRDSRLQPSGDVKLNVELPPAEREASLKRGGDGRVASFDGGWLSAGQGADGELNLPGEAFSIYLRVRDPQGRYGAPLFSKHGGAQRLVYNVYGAKPGAGMLFCSEAGTTGNSKLLEARAPADLFDATTWHDVIVRCDGAKMQLFVDGLWHDEDFMLGKLRQGNPVACLIGAEAGSDGKIRGGFRGQIDHAAIWKRALSKQEIERLSGGSDEVAARREKLNERLQVPMQFYRPHHPDWHVGDCLPMYHDGTYHFYYLGDKRHHGSKNGLGAHQWAHVSSRDLKHWTFHDIAVPITEQWEGSICTGSMYWHDGTYYAFYATRKTDRSGEYLSLATSPDGIHFTKQKPNPFAGPEPPYIRGPFRDPTVFREAATGKFHMLVTAAVGNPVLARRGDCLAHLVSTDLRNWEQKPPFYDPGYSGAPECPDYFKWNDWYYMLSSNQGTARYRMSREPLGPWQRPRLDTFGGPAEYVMKTAPFGDQRRIGAAWIGKDGWGGNAVFREIVQFDDGTLGTRFPEEMLPPTGEAVELRFEKLSEGGSGEAGKVRVRAPDDFGAAALAGMPHNARIRMKVTPAKDASSFGVCVRGTGNYATGKELRLTPALEKVEWRDPWAAPIVNNEWQSIQQVEGLDKPFTLDIVIKDDLIDVCVDNRRTMIVRIGDLKGDRLFLFAQNGDVTFEDIEVRPLK